ncbi:MAG: DbpA RNA binding domain-containing protein, partial [Deltaproteobacteria bacterium]|nr:DbpA RNA binding domain-containing protein [Deltaproteobacteria bacterium]
LNSRDIGKINIFDQFSLVDLPKDISQEKLHKLKTVWICDEQLQISPDVGSRKSTAKTPFKRKRFGQNKSTTEKTWPTAKKPTTKRRGLPPK